jgi:hypothetical protein
MNSKEGIKRLYEYFKENLPYWLLRFFSSIDYSFQETYLKEPWQKIANIKRPDELVFNDGKTKISPRGISDKNVTIEWKNISATAFRIATLPRKGPERISLLVLLSGGSIRSIKLGTSVDPYKLLGHYIEEYKQLYFQSERNKN